MRSWSSSWSLCGLIFFALAAGCYSPTVAPGVACSPAGDCPTGFECVQGSCVPPGTSIDVDAPPYVPDALIDAAPDAPVDAVPDAFVDLTLIAHWEFDDAPENGALDSSGRGHTATCVAACPALVPGKIGSGYRFDPTLDHALIVPDDADFRGNFTLAAWIYADATGIQRAVISKPLGTGSGNSWQLELLDTAKLSFSGGSSHYLENPAVTTAMAWLHVAGTWDGTTKRLYVNGALVASAASAITFDTHDIYLGADNNAGTPVLHWDGVLDDVRVYSRVLSLPEIQALAN